jgi:hypothetical protein
MSRHERDARASWGAIALLWLNNMRFNKVVVEIPKNRAILLIPIPSLISTTIVLLISLQQPLLV